MEGTGTKKTEPPFSDIKKTYDGQLNWNRHHKKGHMAPQNNTEKLR